MNIKDVRVGQAVRLTLKGFERLSGGTATVVSVTPKLPLPVALDFGVVSAVTHNLGGRIPTNTGFWVLPDHIELVEESITFLEGV